MSLTQINKAGLDEIALDHVFTIGASGSSAYTFQGEGLNGTVNNPTLYLTRGKTYRFENGSGGHPIRIQSTSGASGTAYNTGVTNNAGSGTVIVEVQHDAPDVLYYQCTSHAAMNGILYITGALADGGVTTAKIADSAVTTAKIAADAVTNAKIADDAIDSEHYVDGSIDTAHIADGAVNEAKFVDITSGRIMGRLASGTGSMTQLTATSVRSIINVADGANQTTINNNADNRVITGSGTANTLNGESGLTYNGSTNLSLTGSGQQLFTIGSTDAGGAAILLDGDSNGDGAGGDYSIIRQFTNGDLEFFARNPSGATNTIFKQGTSEAMRISDTGRVGIGKTPSSTLDIETATNANGFNLNCVGTAANYLFNVRDDNVSKFYISNNGSVGIGTDNPFAPSNYGTLELNGGSGGCITFSDDDTQKFELYGRDSDLAIYNRTNTKYVAYFKKGGDLELPDGNLKLANGHGIDFSATAQGNGANINEVLDDYEEGTWTPILDGTSYGGNTQGYTARVGNYVKVGRLVSVSMYLTWTNFNGSGGIQILGLPFTCWNNNSNQHAGAIMTDNLNWGGSDGHLTTHNWYNTSYFRIYRSSNNAGWSMVSCDSGAGLICTLTYLADY